MELFRLYIDPGTGSMLFAVLFSVIGAVFYFAMGAFVKLKFLLNGGKKSESDNKKIPIVIFSDDKRYWSVFKPICREFDSRGVDVVYMTASPDDPALENEFEHIKAEFIGEGNKAFSRLNFLNARIVLSTTPGLDVYQWKRSKNVDYYVHIFHSAGYSQLYRMFALDYYDSVMVSGEHQINEVKELEELRNTKPKEFVMVGVPYLDEMLHRLEESIETQSANTTVLLAPSWGKSGILNRFGKEIIDALIATGYNIIIRPHPQSFKSETKLMNELMQLYPESDTLEWNHDVDNFDVLRCSDVMISDFSSVILDYSLVFDKPVIYANTDFDVSPYDAWWSKNPIWMLETIPKLGVILEEETISDIKDIIDRCIGSRELSDNRKTVTEETWANVGEGAKRAVDYLTDKLNAFNKGREEV